MAANLSMIERSGLPLNLIKRDGAPKKIIVSSESQFYCLNNFLGWKEKDIQILPSTRLRVSKKIDMSGKIFLPIKFESSKKIIENLNILVENLKINLSNIKIIDEKKNKTIVWSG